MVDWATGLAIEVRGKWHICVLLAQAGTTACLEPKVDRRVFMRSIDLASLLSFPYCQNATKWKDVLREAAQIALLILVLDALGFVSRGAPSSCER